jgi:uncharacterized protein (TIGR02996 family)
MDTRDRLLLAVFDHLDDSAHQLVLADWLEEHGENDRASVLRLWLQYLASDRKSPEAYSIYQQMNALRDAHEDEWQEHAGITLNHEEFLLLFRWRLAEAIAWYEGPGRERLAAEPEEGEGLAGSKDEEQFMVQRAASRRAEDLRAAHCYPASPVTDLHGGRLLLIMVWGQVSPETPEATDDFINAEGFPPSATWLVYLDEGAEHLRHQPEEPWPYLVVWVPPSCIDQVERAREINEEFHWATDSPCDFTRQVEQAGLLG